MLMLAVGGCICCVVIFFLILGGVMLMNWGWGNGWGYRNRPYGAY